MMEGSQEKRASEEGRELTLEHRTRDDRTIKDRPGLKRTQPKQNSTGISTHLCRLLLYSSTSSKDLIWKGQLLPGHMIPTCFQKQFITKFIPVTGEQFGQVGQRQYPDSGIRSARKNLYAAHPDGREIFPRCAVRLGTLRMCAISLVYLISRSELVESHTYCTSSRHKEYM